MKKIFTLMLTACFALSALAQSVSPLPVPRSQDRGPSSALKFEKKVTPAAQTALQAQAAVHQKALQTHRQPIAAQLDKKAVAPTPASAIRKAPSATKAEVTRKALCVEASYYQEETDWYMAFQSHDARYVFYFDIVTENSESPVGTYTIDDLLTDYSGVFDYYDLEQVEGDYILGMTALSKLEVTEDEAGNYYVTADFTVEGGDVYHVTTDYVAPAVTNRIAYNSTSLFIDDSNLEWDNLLIAEATADTIDIMLNLFPEDNTKPYTTYDETAVLLSLTNNKTGVQIIPIIASVNLTYELKDGTTDHIFGTISDYGGNEYTLDLLFSEPEVTEEIPLIATNLFLDDAYTGWGVIYVSASTEKYDIEFALDYEGTLYGEFDYVPYFTLIDIETGEEESLNIYQAEIIISQAEDGTPVVQGAVITKKGVRYEMQLTLVFPSEAVREASLTFTGSNIQIVTGEFQVQGNTEILDPEVLDGYYDQAYMSVALFCEGESIAGNYTSADVDADYTIFEFSSSSSDYDYEELQVKLDNIVVTDQPEAKTYTLTADVMTLDAVLYHVTIVANYPYVHMRYDTEEGAIERAFTKDEAEEIEVYDYTGVYVADFYADSPTHLDELNLAFCIASEDPDLVIPAGVYAINNSLEAGTVQASPGIRNNRPTPSHYATYDEENYYVDFYFLVSGTVTVAHVNGELQFVVDALNSFDVPVKISYNVQATGLENTQAEAVATKRITRDGQLQILRGEHIYNASGARLK